MERAVSALGLVVFIALAVAASRNRKAIDWKMVASSLAIQFIFAVLLLWTAPGKAVFEYFGTMVQELMNFALKGANFVFGDKMVDPGGPLGFVFAARVLPTIVFFASLMNVLYYLGIMQKIVAVIAQGMRFLLKTSGAETLCAAANIFMGQTEAPLLIRPYIATLTQSEIMVMMVAGFSTLAAGVMFLYASFLTPFLPSAAGHLLAASVLSAPAAIMMAKIIVPETEEPVTRGEVKMDLPRTESNVIEAAASGASTGMSLAINVAAMLIAFISLIALLNFPLNKLGTSLEQMLGMVFAPLAWLTGITNTADVKIVGSLMGQSLVLNEFIAYDGLTKACAAQSLSPRSAALCIYALCGFTNLSSVAIQVGGIGAMAEERKKDLARLGFLALFAATLTNLQTAALAGIVLPDQKFNPPAVTQPATASPTPAPGTATPAPATDSSV